MGNGKWLPLVLLAGGLGCTSLAGLDGDYQVGDTSTGSSTSSGSGGDGGTTSGTGGSTSGTGGSTSGTGGSTGGSGGVGGTTSGTGGVGGTTSGSGGSGPEDCLDGQDNNGDNLIDCADPLCQTDYECVPDVSQQLWTGYFELDSVAYPPSSVQPCPDSSSPQVSFSGPGGAATCSACTCIGSSGTCSYPQMGLWLNTNSCAGTQDYTLNPQDGNCHGFPTDCGQFCSNDQRVRLTHQGFSSGGSCTAGGGTPTVPPLWTDEHHLCPLPPAGAGCGSGSVCVPKQSCVHQKGSLACPNDWPNDVSAYGNATDTRGCTNCFCAQLLGCPGAK
ncbi:MAG: hypothetical protein JRI68_28300, partial [Deltaproteobacteria bacterium]|nr:hypothetical protein [Deltaproteobacteria bacterium]